MDEADPSSPFHRKDAKFAKDIFAGSSLQLEPQYLYLLKSHRWRTHPYSINLRVQVANLNPP